METVELKCEKRATQTKGDVRALRRNGRIPGVIYGPKTPPTALTVDSRELRERVAKASVARIIRFSAPGSELDSKHVIIKQIQRAPISGDIIHADFYEVNLNERIRVAVPLRFVGRAIGVADGGILQPLVRQIEVESLPLEIPELIEVDVSELGIHDAVHVSSVKVPGAAKPIYDSDFAVVTVLPPTIEEAPTPAAAAEAAAAEATPEGAAAEGGEEPAAAEGAAKEGGEKAAPAAKKEGGGKK